MKIIIAGAGIGGLTAAMCLSRAGFDVEVFEAVGELRPLGVGINVQAGGVRLLSGPRRAPVAAPPPSQARLVPLPNPQRPENLGGSGRPPSRPAVAAILDPSRR